jgi:acetylornithine deacetylase/succinyl-diaminopimelate desuccinylase-like protein
MTDDARDELVELHQALVRIPTVNTGAPASGNEVEACRFLERYLAIEGIQRSILEAAPMRGNFLASIGDQSRPRLLWMSHLDVVPVEDESLWTRPAFGGDIADGKVFGRGSDDAKSLVSTGVMALVLLKRAQVSLQGQVRFLATADEEAGGRYGIGWLARVHPEQIRADWAINEGGGIPIAARHGLAYFLAVGEKGRVEARLKFEGRSAHAARPWLAENALYKLQAVLKRLHDYEPECDLRLPFFSNLHLLGIEEQVTTDTMARIIEEVGQYSPAVASQMIALSRMTIAPTMISGGMKSNSIPPLADLVCDIRTLPHQDQVYVESEIAKLTRGITGVSWELETTAVANASPFEVRFVNHLQQAIRIALDDASVNFIPSLTVGFTDSRYVRPLGAQVYGFSPLKPGSELTRPGVHGVDEAMEVDNLVLRTKMLVTLAYLVLSGYRA